MKFLLALLLLLPVGGQDIMREVILTAMSRNVWVETDSQQGSGVIISKNHVLTCFHALEVDSAIKVGVGENAVKAKILKVDPEIDLCLLEVPTEDITDVVLAEDASINDKVFYVGNPKAHYNVFSPGRVVWLHGHNVYTNTLGMGGASGSGLYNTRGELVGITQTMEGKEGEGYPLVTHINFNVVRYFLKGTENGNQ